MIIIKIISSTTYINNIYIYIYIYIYILKIETMAECCDFNHQPEAFGTQGLRQLQHSTNTEKRTAVTFER